MRRVKTGPITNPMSVSARNAVISELEFVGFKLSEEADVDGLDENYFIRFVKPGE